jgi:hypothetical protein
VTSAEIHAPISSAGTRSTELPLRCSVFQLTAAASGTPERDQRAEQVRALGLQAVAVHPRDAAPATDDRDPGALRDRGARA